MKETEVNCSCKEHIQKGGRKETISPELCGEFKREGKRITGWTRKRGFHIKACQFLQKTESGTQRIERFEKGERRRKKGNDVMRLIEQE